jgi:hypothetical protein
MKFKLLILSVALANGAFALSLGDFVNPNTIKSNTTTTQVMKLVKSDNNHKEYMIKSSSNETLVLVNKNNQVYGFKWDEKSANLKSMLGSKYYSDFADAYKNRTNKFNHRYLSIDTPTLLVHQFGLPNGKKQGGMVAKDLAPQ